MRFLPFLSLFLFLFFFAFAFSFLFSSSFSFFFLMLLLLSSSFFFLMLYSSLSIVVWLPSDHRHCYLFPALPTVSLVVCPAAGHSAAPLCCSVISVIPAVFLTSIFDRRGCFVALAITAPPFLAATILAAIRPIRPLLFLAASATNFDHRLAATTIYVALRPLASAYFDCLRSFRPLLGHADHCGHSSATPIARCSVIAAIRFFLFAIVIGFVRIFHHRLRLSPFPAPLFLAHSYCRISFLDIV